MSNSHEEYMRIALYEAKQAYLYDEVPVGAIVVFDNKIISRSFNKKEKDRDITSHAEILVLRESSKKLNNWRLNNCIIYVTLEPCPMCMGAIIQSRVQTVVFGAKNPIYGSVESVLPLYKYYPDSKNLNIVSGILEEESAYLLKGFFRNKKVRREEERL